MEEKFSGKVKWKLCFKQTNKQNPKETPLGLLPPLPAPPPPPHHQLPAHERQWSPLARAGFSGAGSLGHFFSSFLKNREPEARPSSAPPGGPAGRSRRMQ